MVVMAQLVAGGLLQRQRWGGGGGGGGGQRPHFGAGGKSGATCTCHAIEEVVFEEQAFLSPSMWTGDLTTKRYRSTAD